MSTKTSAWNKGKKELIKHVYYTNGEINIRIKETDIPPEGFYRGRIVHWSEESKQLRTEKARQTCLDRYGDANYNNSAKNKQTKLLKYGDENFNNRYKASLTCVERYGYSNPSLVPEVKDKISSSLCGHECSQETRNKISEKRLGSHLSNEMRLQKIYNTNETFHEKGLYKQHKTKPELFIEKYLIDTFGEENVEYSYVDIERYPFKCDFYVKSYDLFIEVHAGWRHNIKPFDSSDTWCLEELSRLKSMAETSDNYKNAIYQWTELDVKKLDFAINNNLNFVRLYPDDIYFINEKPRELLENLVEMYRQRGNQQPRPLIWE